MPEDVLDGVFRNADRYGTGIAAVNNCRDVTLAAKALGGLLPAAVALRNGQTYLVAHRIHILFSMFLSPAHAWPGRSVRGVL